MDDQFYPDGVGAWLAKLDVDTENGGLVPDARFFPHGDDFRGRRVHQTRLQGGDASSDSYCYPCPRRCSPSAPSTGSTPGMGWLFAVAIGLQERRRAAVLAAIGPSAVGHLVSMAAVAVAVGIGLSTTTSQVVSIVGGALAVGMGMWLLLRRSHFRWAGMKLTAFQLATWSFLMASVHGAGLMLVPVLAPSEPPRTTGWAPRSGKACSRPPCTPRRCSS